MAYDRTREEEGVPASPVAQQRVDFEVAVGPAYVPVGVERGFTVLDGSRAAILHAWTTTLIPAIGSMPSAGDVGAAEYIDATASAAPSIRAPLLAAIDSIQQLAQNQHDQGFELCDAETRTAILGGFERADTTGSFAMVHDLTYEAYYGNARVLAALEVATGWSYQASVGGSEMEPFDDRLLDQMKARQPRYREAKG